MLLLLKALTRAAKGAFIPLALIYALARHYTAELPGGNELSPQLKSAPIQEATEEDEFTFEYRGTTYLVQPKASYTLNGLIVSHNNIQAFDDIYHDANSVDLKDICVVWGTNAFTGIYQQMQFWSEPWSCNYRFDRETGAVFDPAQLSNNHLLTDDPEIQSTIKSLRRGDQVELSGMLVNYRPALYPDHLRKTSLVRTDTGNGACEVFFVENAKVLRRANPGWWTTRELSFCGIVASLALALLGFALVPYFELRQTIDRNASS